MFKQLAAEGKAIRAREKSQQTSLIGDESAMIVCVPSGCAEGILGDIVGHLNQLSPWNPDRDFTYWGNAWHAAEHAYTHNNVLTDDPWEQPAVAEGLVAVGNLWEINDSWDDTPRWEEPALRETAFEGQRSVLADMWDDAVGGWHDPTDDVNAEADEFNMCSEAAREIYPGLACCTPAVGYDLWSGLYDREPAFWGKYSLRARWGDAGPIQYGEVMGFNGGGEKVYESEYAREKERRVKMAQSAARRFAKFAADFATEGSVTYSPHAEEGAMVVVPGSEALPEAMQSKLSDYAKSAARGEGVFWTGGSGVYVFSVNPTTQLVNERTTSGVAALSTLVGALMDSDAQVVPLGSGTFGIVAPGIGNIFNKIKDSLGGDKEGRLKKKVDNLWKKLQKAIEKYKTETGETLTPWGKIKVPEASEDADAESEGLLAVGMVDVGALGVGKVKHAKARKAFSKIRDARQDRRKQAKRKSAMQAMQDYRDDDDDEDQLQARPNPRVPQISTVNAAPWLGSPQLQAGPSRGGSGGSRGPKQPKLQSRGGSGGGSQYPTPPQVVYVQAPPPPQSIPRSSIHAPYNYGQQTPQMPYPPAYGNPAFGTPSYGSPYPPYPYSQGFWEGDDQGGEWGATPHFGEKRSSRYLAEDQSFLGRTQPFFGQDDDEDED